MKYEPCEIQVNCKLYNVQRKLRVKLNVLTTKFTCIRVLLKLHSEDVLSMPNKLYSNMNRITKTFCTTRLCTHG